MKELQAGGVGGVGFGEDGVKGGEGIGDVVLGFLADEDGLVILGLAEGVAEGERGLTPIRDGIAMDGGSVGGCFHGRATHDGGEYRLLNRSEVVSGLRHFASSDFIVGIGGEGYG